MISLLQQLDRDDGAFVLLGRLLEEVETLEKQGFNASEKQAFIRDFMTHLRENSQIRAFYITHECQVWFKKEKLKKGLRMYDFVIKEQ